MVGVFALHLDVQRHWFLHREGKLGIFPVFVAGSKHKIWEEEEEAQDHYATIRSQN